jgi:serine/threonine protein phosphatase PrpC
MSLEKIENLEIASISYLSAAASHVGLRRQRNEDKFLIDPLRDFFLVVDGMGGHAGGEIAAQIAVETIEERIKETVGDNQTRLRDSIVCANNAIFHIARGDENLFGMGCVLTALLLKDEIATIANVGDARLYKIHQGKIELVTKDHSVINQLEEDSAYSEIRLMRHPRRNEVFRCVGIEERTTDENGFVDIINIEFLPEHAFLLCSDGLSDLVTSAKLLELILTHAESPQTLVRLLVDEANRAGGTDNITAIFIKGQRFQQTLEMPKLDSNMTWKERVFSFFLSRKAILFYGIILGGLIVYALRNTRVI